MKETDKIKFLKQININGISLFGSKIDKDVILFNAKYDIHEREKVSILKSEGIKNTHLFYIFSYLLKEGLIVEDINCFDEKYRLILTEKGKYEIEKSNNIIYHVQLYANDYPFFFALIIGFIGGLSATFLNLFFN